MKKFELFFISIFLFCLFSCSNLFDFDSVKLGSICLALPNPKISSKAVSDNPSEDEFMLYTVTVDSTFSDFSSTKTGKPGDQLVFNSLKPGEYKISLKFESNTSLMIGETTVEVFAGQNTVANITLKETDFFSDPHVIVEEDPEFGLKFTIKKLPEDNGKQWSKTQLFNFDYGLGICPKDNLIPPEPVLFDEGYQITTGNSKNSDELILYWPFVTKGEKYKFTFGRSVDGIWESSQIVVIYKGEGTNYELDRDKLNNYLNNCKAEVNTEEDFYSLKMTGIEEKDISLIFPNLNIDSKIILTQLWSGNNSDLTGNRWISENCKETESFIGENYEIDEIIQPYSIDLYKNTYNNIWAVPNLTFVEESFSNQSFILQNIISNIFEILPPKYASAEHFTARTVDNGIEITIKTCEDDFYTSNAGDFRLCDFTNTYYSVYFNRDLIDELNEGIFSDEGYSFTWPFSKEGEIVTLELQYYLESEVEDFNCRCEKVTLLSGAGEYFNNNSTYDNFDLFEMTYDDSGENSKRIIKSKYLYLYETLLSRLPENSENKWVDFVINASNNPNEWVYDNDRVWITNLKASFDSINEKDEIDFVSFNNYDEEEDKNCYISKLFNGEGLDIADRSQNYFGMSSADIFEKIGNHKYIICELNIHFSVPDSDINKYGHYGLIFHSGTMENKPLKNKEVNDPNVKYNYYNGNELCFTLNTDNIQNIEIQDEKANAYIFNRNIHNPNGIIDVVWPFKIHEGNNHFKVFENTVNNGYLDYEFDVNSEISVSSTYSFENAYEDNDIEYNSNTGNVVVNIITKYDEETGKDFEFKLFDSYSEPVDFEYVVKIYTNNCQNDVEVYYDNDEYPGNFAVSNFTYDDILDETFLSQKFKTYLNKRFDDSTSGIDNFNQRFNEVKDFEYIASEMDIAFIPRGDDNFIGEFRFPVYSDMENYVNLSDIDFN